MKFRIGQLKTGETVGIASLHEYAELMRSVAHGERTVHPLEPTNWVSPRDTRLIQESIQEINDDDTTNTNS